MGGGKRADHPTTSHRVGSRLRPGDTNDITPAGHGMATGRFQPQLLQTADGSERIALSSSSGDVGVTFAVDRQRHEDDWQSVEMAALTARRVVDMIAELSRGRPSYDLCLAELYGSELILQGMSSSL